MTDLKELLSRVEAASGPDREIDRDLWLAFGLYPPAIEDIGRYDDPSSGCTGGVIYSADHLSASLDAAVALVEKMLPLSTRHIRWYGQDRVASVLLIPHFRSFPYSGAAKEVSGATEPLALCAALLTALIASRSAAPVTKPGTSTAGQQGETPNPQTTEAGGLGGLVLCR